LEYDKQTLTKMHHLFEELDNIVHDDDFRGFEDPNLNRSLGLILCWGIPSLCRSLYFCCSKCIVKKVKLLFIQSIHTPVKQ